MAESMTWQSIETAPQDGTAILVYTEWGMAVVIWIGDDDGWWYVNDNKHGPFALRGPSPTHWMPLPAKPGG
jgi:hypothetical protein